MAILRATDKIPCQYGSGFIWILAFLILGSFLSFSKLLISILFYEAQKFKFKHKFPLRGLERIGRRTARPGAVQIRIVKFKLVRRIFEKGQELIQGFETAFRFGFQKQGFRVARRVHGSNLQIRADRSGGFFNRIQERHNVRAVRKMAFKRKLLFFYGLKRAL